jgi:hypothetical protein
MIQKKKKTSNFGGEDEAPACTGHISAPFLDELYNDPRPPNPVARMRLQNARPILLPTVLLPTLHAIAGVYDISGLDESVAMHVFSEPEQQHLLRHVLGQCATGTIQGHHITTPHATQHPTMMSYNPVAWNYCGKHCKGPFLYIGSSNCIGIHMSYRYSYSAATCCI